MASASSSPAQITAPAPRPVAWLAGAVAGTALLSLLAAQLPDRAKLLGLFPLFWGSIVGAILRWWAEECYLFPPPAADFPLPCSAKLTRRYCLAALLLLAAGEAGLVLQPWQAYRTSLQREYDKDPGRGIARQALENMKADQPGQAELKKMLEADVERTRQMRRQAKSLGTFLSRRLKAVGRPSSPWPELFFAGEILFGSLAGLYFVRHPLTVHSPLAAPPSGEIADSPE